MVFYLFKAEPTVLYFPGFDSTPSVMHLNYGVYDGQLFILNKTSPHLKFIFIGVPQQFIPDNGLTHGALYCIIALFSSKLLQLNKHINLMNSIFINDICFNKPCFHIHTLGLFITPYVSCSKISGTIFFFHKRKKFL